MSASRVAWGSVMARDAREADVPVMPLAHWTLCLLAFAIPLEYPDRFAYEVTTMAGALFLLSTVVQPRACFGRLPWALACYALFLYLLLVSLVTQGTTYPGGLYLNEVSKFFLLLLLWVLVFWVCANLFRQERICRATLWSLVLGCVVRAALPLVGWGRTASVEGAGGERVTILGQSPNQSGLVLAMGLLALIGLVYIQRRGTLRPRFLAWGAVGLLLVSLVQTGSRGGLVTLGVGLLVFSLTGRTLRTRIRHVAVASLALGLLFFFSARSELVRTRIEQAREGNLANRERIYPALVAMFREKPLLGWGPITNKYQLALRLKEPTHEQIDAHNVLLEIITATGLLGLIPFLAGTWLCLRSAWIARAGSQGALPFAMVIAVLAGNMTQNRLAGSLLWVILAYALASSGVVVTRAATPPATPEPRPKVQHLSAWRTPATS
jgi:O-antigen ligase